jgi:uncharacterized protein (TIGR01777 family)
MRLVVAGGSGFLGRPLCEAYAEDGHEVVVLSRALPPGVSAHEAGTGVPGITRHGWVPDGTLGPWAAVIEGAAAVVNLAGESLAARRWSPGQKQRVHDSRVLATRSLASAVLAVKNPPPVLVSASGVNYYGYRDAAEKTEQAPAADDFLARTVVDWEQEAMRAARADTRVVVARSGMVLERGGALARMVTPFRFCLGGPVGSGSQWMSWIHRRDWVEMVRWAIGRPAVSGAVNATAPHPVTNREFASALGHALHRPSLIPAPGFALRLAFGELAEVLLLGGQRVVPARLLELGFYFRYPEIDRALRAIFER